VVGESATGGLKEQMAKHLIDNLPQIQHRLEGVDQLALFLDYDGTLVPFADTPEGALPSPKVLQILRALVSNHRCKAAITSGRELGNLKEMLGDIRGLTLAGSHGLEIGASDGPFIPELVRRTRPLIENIYEELKRELANERGLKLECKGQGLSLACHYRLVSPERVDWVLEEVTSVAEKHDRDKLLVAMPGAKVVELLPRGWHKGKAADMILKRWALTDPFPIYIGDDVADERAIQFLASRQESWLTVRVMSPQFHIETRAEFYLEDPKEVLSFLEWLLQTLQQ